MNEWEIIAADEKDNLDDRVNYFVNGYLVEAGYKLIDTETHYSSRNFQWETLITFK